VIGIGVAAALRRSCAGLEPKIPARILRLR
jgi:hypothetical protein